MYGSPIIAALCFTFSRHGKFETSHPLGQVLSRRSPCDSSTAAFVGPLGYTNRHDDDFEAVSIRPDTKGVNKNGISTPSVLESWKVDDSIINGDSKDILVENDRSNFVVKVAEDKHNNGGEIMTLQETFSFPRSSALESNFNPDPPSVTAAEDDIGTIIQETRDILLKASKLESQADRIEMSIAVTDILATGLSGSVLGLFMGGIVSLLLPLEGFTDSPSVQALAPVLFSFVLATTSVIYASQPTETGQIFRDTLGGMTKSTLRSMAAASSVAVASTTQKLKTVPGDIAEGMRASVSECLERVERETRAVPCAIEKNVQKTMESIGAEVNGIPLRVQTFAEKSLSDMKDELSAIPLKVQTSIEENTAYCVDAVQASPSLISNYIKSMMSNTQKRIFDSWESSMASISDNIEATRAETLSKIDTMIQMPSQFTSTLIENSKSSLQELKTKTSPQKITSNLKNKAITDVQTSSETLQLQIKQKEDEIRKATSAATLAATMAQRAATIKTVQEQTSAKLSQLQNTKAWEAKMATLRSPDKVEELTLAAQKATQMQREVERTKRAVERVAQKAQEIEMAKLAQVREAQRELLTLRAAAKLANVISPVLKEKTEEEQCESEGRLVATKEESEVTLKTPGVALMDSQAIENSFNNLWKPKREHTIVNKSIPEEVPKETPQLNQNGPVLSQINAAKARLDKARQIVAAKRDETVAKRNEAQAKRDTVIRKATSTPTSPSLTSIREKTHSVVKAATVSPPTPQPQTPPKKKTITPPPHNPATQQTQKQTTISLFGFALKHVMDSHAKQRSSSIAAPKHVAVLHQWFRNRNGSLTGFVTNSQRFGTGELITTSPLVVHGAVEGGMVVQTASGSKYYLEPKPQEGKDTNKGNTDNSMHDKLLQAEQRRIAAEQQKKDLERRKQEIVMEIERLKKSYSVQL